jgi:molybdopterin-containing oxidoreductase family iron-sulfur binding subunit
VRRFNFYDFADATPSIQIMRNPEVTIRTRGVMEKCNYCLQRINRARTAAKIEWVQKGDSATLRTPLPGEENEQLPAVGQLTACQQACPTEAIVFGDINDADSYVHKLKYEKPFTYLNYGLLTELNTQPRTTYLRRLSNPNPALTSRDERNANNPEGADQQPA